MKITNLLILGYSESLRFYNYQRNEEDEMKSNLQSSDKKEKDTIETGISICNSNNTKYMNFLNVFGLDILDNKSLVEELRRKLYMHKTKTTHRTPRLQNNDEFAAFLDQDNSEIVMKNWCWVMDLEHWAVNTVNHEKK